MPPKITDQQAVALARELARIEPSVDASVKAPKVSDAQAKAILRELAAEDAKMRKALGLPTQGKKDQFVDGTPAGRLAQVNGGRAGKPTANN